MRLITGLVSDFEACSFIKYFLWLNIFRDKSHTSSDEVTSLRLTLIEIVKVIFYLQFRFSSLLKIVTFAWDVDKTLTTMSRDMRWRGICGIRIISFLSHRGISGLVGRNTSLVCVPGRNPTESNYGTENKRIRKLKLYHTNKLKKRIHYMCF